MNFTSFDYKEICQKFVLLKEHDNIFVDTILTISHKNIAWKRMKFCRGRYYIKMWLGKDETVQRVILNKNVAWKVQNSIEGNIT